ncbi:MAG: hypothetical protein ABH857_05750 [Elusimicrobiota bacterium]
MLKIKKMLGIGLLGGMVLASGAFAEPPVALSGDVSVVSDYVWRGQLCDDDPSLQTGIYASAFNLSLSLWSSYPLNSNDSVDCEEVDYTIEYGKSLGLVSLAGGYVYYDFPNNGSAYATELYVKAGADIIASPSLTYYYDFTDSSNTKSYISIDGSYGIGSLSLGGHIGFYSDDQGSDIGLTAGYEIKLPSSALTPSVSYSIPCGNLADTQDSKLYAGVKLGFGL